MSRKYFNEEFALHQTKGHLSVMDGEKVVELPIVNGVVSIPDELADKVVMAPGWVAYTGQAPANDEELQFLKDVDAFYNGSKKAKSASGS